jgi:hypothetical protein
VEVTAVPTGCALARSRTRMAPIIAERSHLPIYTYQNQVEGKRKPAGESMF